MTHLLLVLDLAIAALMRDRFQLFCNLAMILGIVVPLLTVLGAKNGAVAELIGRLTSDPALLTIETTENNTVTPGQLETIAELPGVVFVIPLSRSQSNWVRVQHAGTPLIRNAELLPTGPGDPLLSGVPELEENGIAVSSLLAERLDLKPGDEVVIVTDAPGRPVQGHSRRHVAAVLPVERHAGQAILIEPAFLEMTEAFADGYAVPELGVTEGRDPATRIAASEGVRVNVATMDDVAPVRRGIEFLLRRNTRSAADRIERTLATVRDLEAAFGLVALVGFIGVAAALIGAQMNDVMRRRRVLATLSLMGTDRRALLLMPLVQSGLTILLGLALSLLVFLPASALAERILDPGSATAGAFVYLRWIDFAAVMACGIVIALVASALAARQILAIDPALVLRETT